MNVKWLIEFFFHSTLGELMQGCDLFSGRARLHVDTRTCSLFHLVHGVSAGR